MLVAEDTAANQRLVRLFLEKQGHRVTVVENGKEAVDAITLQHFDLVLMDIQMPVMNGLEATEMIRRTQLAQIVRPVPIIALTANAMQGDRDVCLKAGMNGYVAKPIRRDELYGEIQRVVTSMAAMEDETLVRQTERVLDVSLR